MWIDCQYKLLHIVKWGNKMDNDKLYDDVHNYTKYKLVEMLINRMNDGRVKVDDINSIEDLTEDILKVISIAGMKYYQELNDEFS